MNINSIGWDVGGAHLKAVQTDPTGKVLNAVQTACPLWKGEEQLDRALERVLVEMDIETTRHAVTMTGELADIFADRIQGVQRIAERMRCRLGAGVRFYAAGAGMVDCSRVPALSRRIASANWHASACFVASKLADGLLIDIGSTTTDIIAVRDGAVANIGFSDAERLRGSELVYTGVTRTPLMAVAQSIDFKGYGYRLAAEHFATTADVYAITGDLAPAEDMSASADGAEKGLPASMRRLARMLGHDKDDASDADWRALAQTFRDCQLRQLEDAVTTVLARDSVALAAPVIAVGAGSFLVAQLAARLGRKYIAAEHFIVADSDTLRHWAAICLPAYAVSCQAAYS